jgi:hypothetical protein
VDSDKNHDDHRDDIANICKTSTALHCSFPFCADLSQRLFYALLHPSSRGHEHKKEYNSHT